MIVATTWTVVSSWVRCWSPARGRRTAGRSLGLKCIEAARSLDFPLLEFHFALEDREMVLVAVDPLPTLVAPGPWPLAGRLLCTLARNIAVILVYGRIDDPPWQVPLRRCKRLARPMFSSSKLRSTERGFRSK